MRDVEQLRLGLGKKHVVVDLGCRKLFLTPDEARTFAGKLDEKACELARRLNGDPPPSKRIHFLRGGLPLCGFTRDEPRHWPPGHCWAYVDNEEARANVLMCQACLALSRRA